MKTLNQNKYFLTDKTFFNVLYIEQYPKIHEVFWRKDFISMKADILQYSYVQQEGDIVYRHISINYIVNPLRYFSLSSSSGTVFIKNLYDEI